MLVKVGIVFLGIQRESHNFIRGNSCIWRPEFLATNSMAWRAQRIVAYTVALRIPA